MKHFLLTIMLFTTMRLWVGGLNACQFGRMDLDRDGKKDLLVFDRHGNRLLCFLNKGGVGEVDYQYAGGYEKAFPELVDWVVFIDYDGDGLEDIFTYSKGWAGIKVYRNISDDHGIGFEPVVTPYLSSWQGGGEVNILATDVDYPAIVDMDGDGDLDLLTFGVMGTFIEKHTNLSMERYGCRDSLVFERTDLCWGRVAESEEDNLMYLDTCLFGYGLKVKSDGFRHRGATVTLHDLNGDGLLDLLLADVDYPGLTLLLNGGDATKAVMVQQMDFPQNEPVNLHSMPVPYFTDINNDGLDDLLVSPFDPNPMASDGYESIWLYLNHGTNEIPDLQLYSRSFLQDRMLDFGKGAYPVVVDWDGDGLKDLMVGSIDRGLTWMRNVGNASAPVFEIVEMAFPGLERKTGLVPACADLDGDGKMECLVGTSEGPVLLFDHEGRLLDEDFLSYDHPWSAPCFFDIDQDGVAELVVGNASGRLSLYRRTSGGAEFVGAWASDTDYWGEVDVRDYSASYYGYSVPSLFQWRGETLLAVGSESGKVYLFEGVTMEEGAVFQEVSDRWAELFTEFPLRFGMRSSVAVADMDQDGQPEIFVGNFGGGLQLFNADIPIHNLGLSEMKDGYHLEIFPNPVSSQLHIISKDDDIKKVIITDIYGRKCLQQPAGAREVVLEVSSLAGGVYLMVLELERGLVNRIFLKR